MSLKAPEQLLYWTLWFSLNGKYANLDIRMWMMSEKMPNFIGTFFKTKYMHFLQWYSSSAWICVMLRPFWHVKYNSWIVYGFVLKSKQALNSFTTSASSLSSSLLANPRVLLMWQMNVCNGATSCIHYIKIATQNGEMQCEFLPWFFCPLAALVSV